MTNPWAEIQGSPLSDAVSARRVSSSHPVDIFWAKDTAGAYCFFADNVACEANLRLPQLLGIELILTEGSERDKLRIVLKLRNNEWWQVFYVLCCDIVETSSREPLMAFENVLLARLVKWQSMLKLLSERRLSPQELQGLWGELMFLREHVAPKFGWKFGIDAWKGPCGNPQDFSIEDAAIEIKTLQNTGRGEVKISSFDQLDPIGDKMFLHVLVVGTADGDASAMSLNELVANIRESIGANTVVKDEFDGVLTRAGYICEKEYDLSRFVVTAEYTYEVREGFPRVRKSKLPIGVESGSYTISLSNCDKFLGKPDWMED